SWLAGQARHDTEVSAAVGTSPAGRASDAAGRTADGTDTESVERVDGPLLAVAVDGKTVRGAVDDDGHQTHLLAAATHGQQLVLGQVEVGAKWPSPKSVETSDWRILVLWGRSSCLVPAAVQGCRPQRGSTLAVGHPQGVALTPARTAPRWVAGSGPVTPLAPVGRRGWCGGARRRSVRACPGPSGVGRGCTPRSRRRPWRGPGPWWRSAPGGAARTPGWSARTRSRRCPAPTRAGPSTGGCPTGRRRPAPARRCTRCPGRCAG